ncbi:MAG: amino acid adenylation domain-containing protein, partial [Granulosicoccus sp.]
MSKHTISDFSFPEKKCVHELFESQVDRLPNATALVFGDQSMSYGELDKKANQLAHFLQSKGIKPELSVAICLERSLEMMIAILGVLKAGGAYVPIDPNYPQERIQFMLEDTDTTILLTQEHLKDNIPASKSCEIICLDSDWKKISKEKNTKPSCQKLLGNLIYTIYTSGSTGKPKGVQVEDRNVVNLIQGQMDFVQHPVKRFLYAYSFAFDGSVLLMWWTLLQGAIMVIAEEGMEKDVQLLGNFIGEHKISHLLTFPSVYTILLDQVNVNRLLSLESVSVAGETCPSNLVIQHQQILPKTKLFNQYGPTEATVGATIYIIPENFQGEKVSIGKTIDNVQIFILNEKLEKVNVGEIGEIHIGGKGIARGYLNRKELTEEKFIQNPFGEKRKDRLYKTGDLGRFLPDGNIDFVGRADHQVKLRGYRIEMGEVEAAISQHPNVREIVVEISGEKSADQKLIGYLTLKNGAQLNATQLRNFLEEKIPGYMIPSTFMFLEKMPFAASGKIDRKNLPQPNNARPELEQKFAASETNLEDWLTQLWQEALGLEKIGIDDKFFELGGNSLQAAAFVAKVQKELNETVFIVSIFEAPTIRAYAKFLEKNYKKSLTTRSVTFQSHVPEQPQSQTLQENNSTKNSAQESQTKTLTPTDFKAFKNYIPTFIKKVKKQNHKNPPAIFILAPPRSGTTLLRIMLAGHPQLFAANELQLLHFNTLQERKEAYTGKFSLWSEGTIRTIMELKNCNADEAKSIMQNFEKDNLTTQDFYHVLQNWVGNRIIVDKSPSYAMDMMALEKAEADFDNAIFIHLSRHPYSMIKSFEKMYMDQVMFLKKHNYNSRNTGELIWAESHQNISNFLKNIPADRQFRIIYEDLVQQPKEVMQEMCETIGLPFHPNLLNPYLDIEKKMTDGLYDNSKPMGDPNILKYGSIKSKKAEEWKKVKDDNFLHPKTWKLAEEIGYTPTHKVTQSHLMSIDPPTSSSISTSTHKVTSSHLVSNPTTNKKQEQLNTHHSSLITPTGDIAIIGMSGRFPGAKNLTEFWENLINEKDVSVEFTAEELKANGIDPSLLNDPNYVKRGMPLQDADKFDASFFGYLPKEAALMDPQHRIFLECAYAALEDAGYVSEKYQGTIGIYGGVARNTYLVNNVITHPEYFKSIEDFTKGITQEKDFPATRVAYKLNLKGAAVNVQTACSSSGVAVHLACQSLLSGDNDMMLVGGGRIQPPVEAGHLHTEGHALSPDGYCRSFDADADGMVRGNGMAFIVLKKLEKAIADGDSIHAIIKSTAIGNDGSDKVGFTAPSVQGQAATIAKAYQKANINPETISYIEAHGTGTRIGDPIEIAALTQAFSRFTDKKNFCAISSVKSNIGHFDAGAGVAGIIKTVLSFKHGKLPTTLHFKQPNPQIDFKHTPFFVNDKLRRWEKGNTPRRAGVSSFGLGGTNAHIILEEAPPMKKTINTRSHNLLLLSAKIETALGRNAHNLGIFLDKNDQIDLTNAAYTLQVGRNHFQHRLFTIAENAMTTSDALKNLDKKKVFAKTISKNKKYISFMFPGGGAQHT